MRNPWLGPQSRLAFVSLRLCARLVRSGEELWQPARAEELHQGPKFSLVHIVQGERPLQQGRQQL